MKKKVNEKKKEIEIKKEKENKNNRESKKENKPLDKKSENRKVAIFLDKLYKRVDQYRLQGKSLYAIKLLERLVSSFPGVGKIYEKIGHCGMDLGDAMGSLRAYLTAIYFEPENLLVKLGTAECFFILGVHDHSMKLIKEVIEIEKSNFSANLLLGKHYELSGAFQKALIVFQSIEDQSDDSRYSELLCQIGECYLGQQKPEQAIEYLERSLILAPDNMPALLSKAICHGQMNEIEEAFSSVEKVIKNDPENVDALAFSAFYLLLLGKKSQAIARIEKASEIEPDSDMVKSIREEIFSKKVNHTKIVEFF
ncbi:MAG: tetratricopeptide repeat protein [Candidatus Riflebacteria bacterium]|nr:tetratricopeptide repeat protein [Candidatus Riflebacteria bacterium]